MLFSEKYPDARSIVITNKDSGKEIAQLETYENGNYIWSVNRDNCYICGRITHFIETNMKCYICSEECDEALYREVFKEAIKS